MSETPNLEAVQRLSRDLRAAAALMGVREARYYVDSYYDMQDYRIAAANQQRKLLEGAEPGELMQWFNAQLGIFERQIAAMLDKWSAAQPMGEWARCAPPGSMVQTTSGRWAGTGNPVPIESLRNGATVAAFDRRRARLSQSTIRIAETPFKGDLINVGAGDCSTRVTPSHKWLVRLTAPEECRVIYLMRKGGRFRVGQCRAQADTQRNKYGRFHLRRRAQQEGADAIWILKFCLTREEASISEQLISTMFGLPMMCFLEAAGNSNGHLRQSGINDFWSRLDDETQHQRALACLEYFRLNEEIPLSTITKLDCKQFVHCLVVTSINLIPGLMQIPFPIRTQPYKMDWKPIEAIERRPYDGPVYSLDVAEHHKYVQDGMVTCNSICGIGPIIASGLVAHIDITKAPTAGHIWRYAGLDPTVKWAKGQKRPWNASLKRLCWLTGESFVKVSGRDDDVYGHLYQERKAYEQARNDAGELADTAAVRLADGRKKKLDAGLLAIFESGKLPAAALHARAKRWSVKIFLSHWHAEAFRQHYGTEPPAPFPIAHLGHAHRIEPPRSTPRRKKME